MALTSAAKAATAILDGSVRLAGLFPNPVSREMPFTQPGDETGYRWGFGINWRFVPRLSVGPEFSG